MKVSFTHVINASPEAILKAFCSTDFYCRKQKASGALTVDILETEDLSDGGFRFRAKVSEPSRLPGFLRKSDVDTYEDETRVDVKNRRLEWNVTPGFGADKFVLRGAIELEEQGDATSVTYSTEMQINVPLVGKKAEQIGLARTEEETSRQAAFLRSWLAE